MDTFLLAPALADVQDGAEIEQVWFARDDMAAMAGRKSTHLKARWTAAWMRTRTCYEE